MTVDAEIDGISPCVLTKWPIGSNEMASLVEIGARETDGVRTERR